MLNLPVNTVLGELTLLHTFEFFDIPRLFTCRNKSGAQFLVLSISDDGFLFDWLYLPISNDKLMSIVSKTITLRQAFVSPEDGFLFKVSSSFHGEASVTHVFPEQISNEDLPEENAFLNVTERFDIGFGVVDVKESALISRRETYNLHLYPWDTILPELDVRSLGCVLASFQELVDALGQYCKGEPTLKGAIPVDVLEATKLRAVQIFNGSFGIQLKSKWTSDLFNKSLVSDAFLELTGLFEAGDNEDNISNKLHVLKGRVASKYRMFLKELTKVDSPLMVDWGSPNMERGKSIYIGKQTIKNTYNAVSKIEIDMSDSVVFKAELLGLDVKVKRYRVRNLSDGQDYSGKIADASVEQVDHSEISGVYEVTLKKIIETNSSSGSEYTKWILLNLKPCDQND